MEESRNLQDLSEAELNGIPYRTLQQTAKNLSLPSNVKKVVLIELIYSKLHKSVEELNAVVQRVRFERQIFGQGNRRRGKKKVNVQGMEVSSTNSTREPDPPYRRQIVTHPTTSPPHSDRVLRSSNVRNYKRPNYSLLNNAMFGLVKAAELIDKQETQISIVSHDRRMPRLNVTARSSVRKRPNVSNNDSYLMRDAQTQMESSSRAPDLTVPPLLPAKRPRLLSGIYPLIETDPQSPTQLQPKDQNIQSVGYRRTDGKVAKINALVQKPLPKPVYNFENPNSDNIQNVVVTIQDIVNSNVDSQLCENRSQFLANQCDYQSYNYPSMYGLTDVMPKRMPFSQSGSQNNLNSFQVYYHKKMRAEKLRTQKSLPSICYEMNAPIEQRLTEHNAYKRDQYGRVIRYGNRTNQNGNRRELTAIQEETYGKIEDDHGDNTDEYGNSKDLAVKRTERYDKRVDQYDNRSVQYSNRKDTYPNSASQRNNRMKIRTDIKDQFDNRPVQYNKTEKYVNSKDQFCNRRVVNAEKIDAFGNRADHYGNNEERQSCRREISERAEQYNNKSNQNVNGVDQYGNIVDHYDNRTDEHSENINQRGKFGQNSHKTLQHGHGKDLITYWIDRFGNITDQYGNKIDESTDQSGKNVDRFGHRRDNLTIRHPNSEKIDYFADKRNYGNRVDPNSASRDNYMHFGDSRPHNDEKNDLYGNSRDHIGSTQTHEHMKDQSSAFRTELNEPKKGVNEYKGDISAEIEEFTEKGTDRSAYNGHTNDFTAQPGDLSGNRIEISADRRDFRETEDLSVQRIDLSGSKSDLSAQRCDFSEQREDFSAHGGDFRETEDLNGHRNGIGENRNDFNAQMDDGRDIIELRRELTTPRCDYNEPIYSSNRGHTGHKGDYVKYGPRLPAIGDVFSYLAHSAIVETKPIDMSTSNNPTTLNSALESIYNYKSSMLPTPLLHGPVTANTQSVFSTYIAPTAVLQSSLDNNSESFYSQPCEQDSAYPTNSYADETAVSEDIIQFAEQEMTLRKYHEVSRMSHSSTESVLSQDEMVADAMEIISQDGDYMERINMDVRLQCILCSWAGSKIVLDNHIRKEHPNDITYQTKNEWNVTYKLGHLIDQELCLCDVSEYAGCLYVMSASYRGPDCFTAAFTSITTVAEPKVATLTIYNKVTGEPFTWRGLIQDLPSNLPYDNDINGLTVDLTKLDLLPNSANLTLTNNTLVSKSPGNAIVGQPELDLIHIIIFVKIED